MFPTPTDRVYLKPNLVPEPLVDNWYAWPHLISPVTAAMNITHRHLKIMDSFIENPLAHVMAVQDPRMLGGPFVDAPEESVGEVMELKQKTLTDNADLIELSESIRRVNGLLQENARGNCIEPFYAQLPDNLKGYLELLYDLNHQPVFRFFESLLYRSPFYKEELQSLVLYLTDNDERPFVLSTPRLKDAPGQLTLPVPFKSPALDALFRMQQEAQPYAYARDLLGISPEDEPLFKTFFTADPPKKYQKYAGEGIRTRYFGHACILVESRDVTILTDPVISYYGYQYDVNRFTYSDLPDVIDYVLITHNHQDHILLETMIQLRHRIGTVVVPRSSPGTLQDPNLKLMFQALGFERVIELEELGVIEAGKCTIMGLPFIGEHADLDIRTKLCYSVNVNGYKLLFFADSCNVEPALYRHLHRITGDVDVMFLGMECDGAPLSWLYGPLLLQPISRQYDYARRLKGSDYEAGSDLVRRFNPREVYVYAMGQEPWLKHIMSLVYTEASNPIIASNQLIAECRSRNIVAERLFGEKEIVYDSQPEYAAAGRA